MKKDKLNLFIFISFAVFLALFVFLLGADFLSVKISSVVKIILTALTFIVGFFASFLLSIGQKSPERRYKIIKAATAFLFLAYMLVVLDFTLIDDSFGRDVSNLFTLSGKEKIDYIKNNTNFIPFNTIRLFIEGYLKEYVTLPTLTENILGNLLVLSPFAFFMPIIFKKLNKTSVFLINIIAFVLIIELLQILFLTGSADIDDFILNVLGAFLTFKILKLKGIGNALSKITYGVWEK